MLDDDTRDTVLEALPQRDHVRERCLGQHLAERCADRGQGEHVPGQRSTDAAHVRLRRHRGEDPVSHRLAEPVRGRRDASADRLADRQEVGLEVVRARVTAGARADRVRLVDHEQRPVALRHIPERLVIAGVRQDDADVGQRRLDQHAGDVALRQLALEPVEVVDLDSPRRDRGLDGSSDRVRTEREGPFLQDDEGLVHGAVVAPGVDEHLRPARYLAREADREPVRVGRGQRELPRRQPEAAGKLLAAPESILARQHHGDSAPHLLGDRVSQGGRRVPGHRSGIPEAEVDVLVSVHVHEARASSLLHEHGVRPGPFRHPGHRDA